MDEDSEHPRRDRSYTSARQQPSPAEILTERFLNWTQSASDEQLIRLSVCAFVQQHPKHTLLQALTQSWNWMDDLDSEQLFKQSLPAFYEQYRGQFRSQAHNQAPAQVNQIALNNSNNQADYVVAFAEYKDILLQNYTDLKIVCRGHDCVFNVHRLVVCNQSTFLKDAVAALAPGESINLSDAEPAIMKLLIDAIYISRIDTETVLKGVNNNHFLILLKVYAMAKKYGVNVGMDCVLACLELVMRDMISKIHVRPNETTPLNTARAQGVVTQLTEAMVFMVDNFNALDGKIKLAVRSSFLDSWVDQPWKALHDGLLSMPTHLLAFLD